MCRVVWSGVQFPGPNWVEIQEGQVVKMGRDKQNREEALRGEQNRKQQEGEEKHDDAVDNDMWLGKKDERELE